MPRAFSTKSGETILSEISQYTALPPEEYMAGVSAYFSHPGDQAVISRAFEAVFSGQPCCYDARMKTGDQDFTWCRLHVMPIFEAGRPSRMIGTISNAQETHNRINALESAAYRDSFTGLYAKHRIKELTDMILAENPMRRCSMAVIDLDHFKRVNDVYGHMAGDEVLLAVAENLRHTCRKPDIVARFGGDEFVVLMVDCDQEEARKRCEALLGGADNGYGVTKSIGLAQRMPEDLDFDSLFRKADTALYQAKAARNCYRIFK